MGRGGTFVQTGYGPIRCGRFGVKNARVVKKVGEKETPLGEKETPLGEKATKVGEKVTKVGEKKYIVIYQEYPNHQKVIPRIFMTYAVSQDVVLTVPQYQDISKYLSESSKR